LGNKRYLLLANMSRLPEIHIPYMYNYPMQYSLCLRLDFQFQFALFQLPPSNLQQCNCILKQCFGCHGCAIIRWNITFNYINSMTPGTMHFQLLIRFLLSENHTFQLFKQWTKLQNQSGSEINCQKLGRLPLSLFHTHTKKYFLC